MAAHAFRLKVTVRDARASDLARVAEIKVRNWRDTYAPLVPGEVLSPFLDDAAQVKHLAEDVARPSTILLVAEDEARRIVGFALTYVDEEPDPWLESLHVLREQRSNGAGTALVRATAARLRTRGHAALRLGVVAGNEGAMRFYERLGATHTGREPAAWAPGVMHEIYRWSDLSI